MSKRVYLSPSDQRSNRYAWGDTTEDVQCGRIAAACQTALQRSGVEVLVGQYDTMARRCAASDKFGADLHVPIHTNAFNGKVSGTRLFCYSRPGKGYDACKAIFDALAPLTPGTSENIQVNAKLYEVQAPNAPTAYVECEFHDSEQTARWIVEHTTQIGEAIARGICTYLGVSYAAGTSASEPAPSQSSDKSGTLYRVQVGAFSQRANAEKMLERLKKAGFSGYIVSDR